MFDPTLIKQGFVGLVGLRQNDNPDFPQLSSPLLYTGTNLLVDHPLINIENIDMCARNYAKYTYAAYAPGTTYAADTQQALVRVTYGGKVYRSKLAANVGHQPDISPTYWEEVNLLSAYLEDLFQSANLDALVEVFNRKHINRQVKTILKTTRLFEGGGNLNDRVINDGSLVGLEIVVRRNLNIVAVIERVGLQLTVAQSSLTLYLFHSSSEDAVATISVNHTKTITFQWHTASLSLQYSDGVLEPGGIYYLMYDQNDLAGQAVKKQHNFNVEPCASCGVDNAIVNFNVYNKYFNIRTVKVSAANRNGTDLWDITKTEYVPDNNFGLNLEVTAKCDQTGFILQQKNVFAYAVRDTVIKRLLEAMSNSTRQNDTQTKVGQMARAELQSSVAGGMGFPSQLEKQYKAVEIQISDLDESCMPCGSGKGLSFGAASLSYGR